MRKALIICYVAFTVMYLMSLPHNVALTSASFIGLILSLVGLGLAGVRFKEWLVLPLTLITLSLIPINPYLAMPFISVLVYSMIHSIKFTVNSRAYVVLGTLAIVVALILAGTPYALIGIGSSLIIVAFSEYLRRRKYLVPIIIAYASLGAIATVRLGFTYLASTMISIALTTALIGLRSSLPQFRVGVSIVRRPPKELRPFIVADLIVASVFEGNYISGIVIAALHPNDALFVVGAFIASYGLVGMLYYIYRLLTPKPEMALKPLKSRWYTAFLISRDLTFNILTRYTARLKDLIEASAILENPVIYSARFLMASLISLMVVPPVIALAYPLLGLTSLLMITVPFLILATPFIILKSRIGDRRRGVEDELPWLSMYAASMQAAGIPLYESLRKLIGRGLLKFIEREARYVEKHVVVLGRDAVTALEEVARSHPSRLFRDFITGYTSILRTGGDLVSYLESRTKELLEWMSFRFKKYADTAVGIGEVLTALFTIFVSIIAIAGPSSPAMTLGFTVMGIPVIAVVMYSVITSSQPKTKLMFTTKHFLPALLSLITAVMLYRLGYTEWLAGAIIALVVGVAYGVQYLWQLVVVKAHEEALEDFLRDLTEMRKIGLPPSRAILSLAKERTYNRHFDRIIKVIATQLRLNVPLGEAVARVWSPSWLTRMVLFIVSEIEATGGGTVKVLDNLTAFISSYVMARREMVAKLRIYEFLVMLTPIILSFFISITSALSATFQPQIQRLSGMASRIGITSSFFIPLTSSEGIKVAKLAALESSLAFAVLASKTVDFTIKNTLRVAIVAIMFIIYNLMLDPIVRSLVMSWFSLPTAP